MSAARQPADLGERKRRDSFLFALIPNLAQLGRMPCSWQNGRVSASLNRTLGSALVMRRHVDFKRVCSCCCLP
ncbi:Ms4527A family Cys-rich leader peptide [Mycolicibacterium sp. HS_4_1]